MTSQLTIRPIVFGVWRGGGGEEGGRCFAKASIRSIAKLSESRNTEGQPNDNYAEDNIVKNII